MADRTVSSERDDDSPAAREEQPDYEAELGQIAAGDCLGRYTILQRIGGGGMGEVFAAHDPELSRTVAVKVIRPDRLARSGTARLRLVREAQALARLHHPNVVAVHDVGSDRDRVFIAMELVEGPNVRAWLAADKRDWRTVLDHFVAAGKGLAAAHDAGIVHRDVKPENLLVGRDRVVVVDFGLARAGDDDSAEELSSSGNAFQVDLTMTGDLCGTPPYMAPELLLGKRSSFQSDQYAFCLSLWECLHGERPASVPVPQNREVPRRIDDALRRGLLHDPTQRWGSMHELLEELARDPRAARRRALWVGGALALAGLAVGGIFRPTGPDPCRGGDARIAEAWGPLRANAVRAAFAGVGSPAADDTFERVSARLTDYSTRWRDMYRATCRATLVEGRQSDTLMDLRMACLERRRSVLDGLTSLWAKKTDAETLEHAADAAGSLAALDECADVRSLTDRSPPPSDPALAARVSATRTKLDQVLALVAAQRMGEARSAVAPIHAEAADIGWPLLLAETELAEGEILATVNDPAAEATLLDAGRLGLAARDDRLAARATVRLLSNLVAAQMNAQRAHVAYEMASGLVDRVGSDELRVSLLRARGQLGIVEGKLDEAAVYLGAARALAAMRFGPRERETLAVILNQIELARHRGDYAEARRLGEENLDATIAVLGPEHPQVVKALNELAIAAAENDQRADAAEYFRRALTLEEKIAGPDSAAVAIELNNLGGVEKSLGNLEQAEKLLERALRIREKVLPPDHPYLASTVGNLAEVRSLQGRYDEALALHQRSLDIAVKNGGPRTARVALIHHKMGQTYEVIGDLARALESYQRSLTIRKEALGEDHEMTYFSMVLVGGALVELKRCGEAMPLLETAAQRLEKKVGPTHSDFVTSQGHIARCELEAGKGAEAASRMERVVRVEDTWDHGSDQRRMDRFILARALWAAGQKTRAVVEARRAESEPVQGGRFEERILRELRAWLRARS